MRLTLRPFLIAVATAFGLIVLLGYFFNYDLLGILRRVALQWAVILAAVVLLIGLLNLISVHWLKVIKGNPGGFYSAVLLLTFIVTVAVAALFGPASPEALWIFNYIQAPVESSLMALLAVLLAYACFRLLYRRLNLFSLVFILTALLVLIGTATLPGLDFPIVNDVHNYITQVAAVGGGRGLLLGVALGTIATALRVLIGADRPYGG